MKKKNTINKEKHGLSFSDALSAFYDEMGLIEFDPDHSEAEDRFILLATNYKGELLVISHCYRMINESETIRIISARKATKNEYIEYKEANGL